MKDYIFAAKQRQREMLRHPAAADFGEALAVIGGVRGDGPATPACFLKAYPAETTEAFCDAVAASRSSAVSRFDSL